MAPLRQRYPLLASANVSTFADVISVSAKFLRTNAIKTVGAHAANFYESQPCMDLTEILADASQTVDDYLPPTRYTTLHNRSVIVPPVWLHTCVPPHYNPNHSHDQLRLITHWSILGSRPIHLHQPCVTALICIGLSPHSISTEHVFLNTGLYRAVALLCLYTDRLFLSTLVCIGLSPYSISTDHVFLSQSLY